MKKLFKYFVAIFAVASLISVVSCDDDNEPPQTQDAVASVSAKEFNNSAINNTWKLSQSRWIDSDGEEYDQTKVSFVGGDIHAYYFASSEVCTQFYNAWTIAPGDGNIAVDGSYCFDQKSGQLFFGLSKIPADISTDFATIYLASLTDEIMIIHTCYGWQSSQIEFADLSEQENMKSYKELTYKRCTEEEAAALSEKYKPFSFEAAY